MSDELQETLIKSLRLSVYREAVTAQSPGLPRLGGNPGLRNVRYNPERVSTVLESGLIEQIVARDATPLGLMIAPPFPGLPPKRGNPGL